MNRKRLIVLGVAVMVIALAFTLVQVKDSSARGERKKAFYWRMILGEGSGPYLKQLGLNKAKNRIELAENLNMTRDQKIALWKISKENKDQWAALTADIMQKRMALSELIYAEEIDEDAIRVAAAEVGKAIANVSILRAQQAKASKAIFTPDQIGALKKFGEGRKEMASEVIDRLRN